MEDPLYFRQIPAGPMANFVYAIGCTRTGQAVLVDPAWDVAGLLETLEADGMRLAGALVTHYHPDHCGGSLFGTRIEGLAELVGARAVPVSVHADEAEGLRQVTGLSETDLARRADGDRLRIGDVEVRFLHTPGHTPGSQCFLVGDRLVSGDTLFLEGCGRVDLPGGDPGAMHRSLARLAELPDDLRLFPGHRYSRDPHALLGEVKRTNPFLR